MDSQYFGHDAHKNDGVHIASKITGKRGLLNDQTYPQSWEHSEEDLPELRVCRGEWATTARGTPGRTENHPMAHHWYLAHHIRIRQIPTSAIHEGR